MHPATWEVDCRQLGNIPLINDLRSFVNPCPLLHAGHGLRRHLVPRFRRRGREASMTGQSLGQALKAGASDGCEGDMFHSGGVTAQTVCFLSAGAAGSDFRSLRARRCALAPKRAAARQQFWSVRQRFRSQQLAAFRRPSRLSPRGAQFALSFGSQVRMSSERCYHDWLDRQARVLILLHSRCPLREP